MKSSDLADLWGFAAARCSFGTCRKELPSDDRSVRLNQTAHIVSGKPAGPRADPSYPREEIDRYPNLIVLCTEHHTLVDADQGSRFAAAELLAMKAAHEAWVQDSLAVGVPWRADIGQLEYVNVPRLAMLAGMAGQKTEIIEIPNNLFDLGGSLARLLQDLRTTVNRLSLRAVPLSGHPLDSLRPGVVVSFEQAFRTKNMPAPSDLDQFAFRGDDFLDPHIYTRRGTTKLLLPLNPRWVGTTTAFADFRRGMCWVTGFAQVKSASARLIVATPLVIGVPSAGPWELMGFTTDDPPPGIDDLGA